MIHPIFRLVSYCFACITAVLFAAPTFAAQPHHGKAPLLVVGPQAVPSGQSTPQYGLFGCQVGLSTGQCYDPYQMRHAYGIDSLINAGYDGTGHTIVIVDAFQNPNLVSQIATYNTFYGLPPTNLTQFAPDGLTPFDQTNGDMVGWAEEISLDVEWAHAIAPGANIVLVLSKSDQDKDLLSALNYAVEHNLGDVISMSFGENESCQDNTPGYHDVFAAATAKNITLFASSGDEGAALPSCDGTTWVKAASAPASDPLVTAVGGTELHAADFCLPALGCDPAANPLPGTYLSEIVWNEGPPYGDFQADFDSTLSTGGGFSVLFDEPPWQKSGIKDGKARAVPDIAYNAAVLHGVLTRLDIPGVPPGYYRFGGTSAGSPQWAAITVIANQKAGGRLGFLNSAIYQIGKVNKAYPASFNDVTSGVNSSEQVFDPMGNPLVPPVNIIGFSGGPGWDPTTGFGSPTATSLVDYLIRYVSPGDGQAAISTTKPKPHQPNVPGHMDPH